MSDKLISVAMSEETLSELKWLAEYMGVVPAQALRQAIATQAYIEQAKRENAEFLVRRRNGEVYRVTFHNFWETNSTATRS